ncbi:hypothetical protein [Nostoc sp.]|uniref:hypothetical protein n=1 Tax=Nostoc sp. TaxID=1180 RepID=UPI002FF4460A
MVGRQKANWLLRGIRNLKTTLATPPYFPSLANNIRQGFNRLIKYVARKKLVLFVIGLLLSFGAIIFAAILPSAHIFEGNLIVEEMSFTYSGQEPKLFLQSMRQITNLESEGIQTLTFTGKFKSESLPQLNQLDTLKIELNDSKSKLIIAPANPKLPSEIDLSELRLQPNTTVAGLSYDSYNKILNFYLQPHLAPELSNTPNNLKLYLGEQPLKISLEGYKFIGINLAISPDTQTPIEFNLTPDNKELKLEITQNNKIYITTFRPPQDESEQWFRGKIATKDVQFQRVDSNGNLSDNLAISTIIEGKIRMVEQEREIRQNQFLMGKKADTPLNIERISHLQIAPEKGLEVRISGKTEQIKIGLDKEFPVSSIQGSWLDGVLPRDAIIALFSFGAATITYLLSVLIDNAFKSTSKS